MYVAFQIIHVLISISLIALVLIQTEGSGLGGSAFGGGEIYHSKRGIERGLFIITIVIAVLFSLSSVANVVFA